MKTHLILHQSSMPSNSKTKLVLRRTKRKFNPKIVIVRTIETFAIGSLLFTGFSGVGEICISPIQEIEALRILIYRGEAACRRYLRSVLVKRSNYKMGANGQKINESSSANLKLTPKSFQQQLDV